MYVDRMAGKKAEIYAMIAKYKSRHSGPAPSPEVITAPPTAAVTGCGRRVIAVPHWWILRLQLLTAQKADCGNAQFGFRGPNDKRRNVEGQIVATAHRNLDERIAERTVTRSDSRRKNKSRSTTPSENSSEVAIAFSQAKWLQKSKIIHKAMQCVTLLFKAFFRLQ